MLYVINQRNHGFKRGPNGVTFTCLFRFDPVSKISLENHEVVNIEPGRKRIPNPLLIHRLQSLFYRLVATVYRFYQIFMLNAYNEFQLTAFDHPVVSDSHTNPYRIFGQPPIVL